MSPYQDEAGITGWAQVKHKYERVNRGCEAESAVRPLLFRKHVAHARF